MKIVLANSKEPIAENIKNFLERRGHEVVYLLRSTSEAHELSFDHVKENGMIDCDVVINMPEKLVLEKKGNHSSYQNLFLKTRIEPTQFLKESLLKAKNPPKVWISFSSVACYPKAEAQFFNEKAEFGEDLTAQLVKQWEEAATLPEDCKIRGIIPRLGILISRRSGLLPKMLPFFHLFMGSVVGRGDEAFPWIYQKDLYWFLDFAIANESIKGVFNTVAPQKINSRDFSQALGLVVHKPVYFKFSKKFFDKRLGDVAEIILAKSFVYPSRLLNSGFEFRYPAIYPALVDCLSRGSGFK